LLVHRAELLDFTQQKNIHIRYRPSR